MHLMLIHVISLALISSAFGRDDLNLKPGEFWTVRKLGPVGTIVSCSDDTNNTQSFICDCEIRLKEKGAHSESKFLVKTSHTVSNLEIINQASDLCSEIKMKIDNPPPEISVPKIPSNYEFKGSDLIGCKIKRK